MLVIQNWGGVEISEDAINLMKQVYPEMAKQIKIYNSPVEDIIKDFEDNAFNVVFTMAFLEHIHPDSKFIFPEMVRITSKYLITIEDERGTSWRHFPRNYKRIFEFLGPKEIQKFNCEGIRGLGPNFQARIFLKGNVE